MVETTMAGGVHEAQTITELNTGKRDIAEEIMDAIVAALKKDFTIVDESLGPDMIMLRINKHATKNLLDDPYFDSLPIDEKIVMMKCVIAIHAKHHMALRNETYPKMDVAGQLRNFVFAGEGSEWVCDYARILKKGLDIMKMLLVIQNREVDCHPTSLIVMSQKAKKFIMDACQFWIDLETKKQEQWDMARTMIYVEELIEQRKNALCTLVRQKVVEKDSSYDDKDVLRTDVVEQCKNEIDSFMNDYVQMASYHRYCLVGVPS